MATAWCSRATDAYSTARSVSSPFGRAARRPSNRPSTGAATPAAVASCPRNDRRGAGARGASGSAIVLSVDPEIEDGQMAGQLDHVTGQMVHREPIGHRGQAFGMGVHQGLLGVA